MIDAYAHLDMSVSNPLGDLESRMDSSGIRGALLVETWSGDNYPCLERLIVSPLPQFRLALCFRPDRDAPSMKLLDHESVVALRIKPDDLSRIEKYGAYLESSGKWLLVHANAGIGKPLGHILSLAQTLPRMHTYVPHFGWPRLDGQDDPDWLSSITQLSSLAQVVVGFSAIAHFSRLPFPHQDVRGFARQLLRAFNSNSIVVGSDYPLFMKDFYDEYMRLATDWIREDSPAWSPDLERSCFHLGEA